MPGVPPSPRGGADAPVSVWGKGGDGARSLGKRWWNHPGMWDLSADKVIFFVVV